MPYRPGLSVLDCQCGKGTALRQLARRTGATWGIDLSWEELTFTPSPRRVCVASSQHLPFADEIFDVAICQRSVPWMEADMRVGWPPQISLDHSQANGSKRSIRGLRHTRSHDSVGVLRELARVLCRDGRLVFLTPREPGLDPGLGGLTDALVAAGMTVTQQEPFDYLAYPTAVLASRVPSLARSYAGTALVQMMFALDRILAQGPAFQAQSWHRIIVAAKTE